MSQTTANPTAIQSGINEKKFFASMKHMFATSFSVISEAMQNSRRAGATKVDIQFAEGSRNVVITDDGCGISDFSVLVNLCDSGWSEGVTLQDNPFGMGFFSNFFSCEKVVVRSKGMLFSATLDDISSKRKIRVVVDPNPVLIGTILELHGATDDLCRVNEATKEPVLKKVVGDFAKGFPIEVHFNGQAMDRPHALENLKHEVTLYGAVHIKHLHDASPPQDMLTRTFGTKSIEYVLYLQGLPINSMVRNHSWSAIVHLDSQRFNPLMPDRSRLYNGEDQLAEMRQHTTSMIHDFLAMRKTEMEATEFVRTYWEIAASFNAMELFNDIPWIPAQELSVVGALEHRSVLRTSLLNSGRVKDLVSRTNLLDGTVNAWRDVEMDALVDVNVGPILKVMQRRDIAMLNNDHAFHEGHWIFKAIPSAADMVAKVETSGLIGSGADSPGYFEVSILIVKEITVTITSDVAGFEPIVEVISNDWIPVADEASESAVVYMSPKDESSDQPVDVFSNFEDENDRYRSDWHEAGINSWNATIAGLLGSSLAEVTGGAILNIDLPISSAHRGQLVLATAQSLWYPHSKTHGPNPVMRVFDLEKSTLWDDFAALIAKLENPTGEQVKSLFVRVTGAQALEAEPVELENVQQPG